MLTKIVLTSRRPVAIDKDNWPVIASAIGHKGTVPCVSNEEWRLSVRQHADGRAIVYGIRYEGPGGMPAGYRGWDGGELLPAGADIAAAIERVGKDAGMPDAYIRECIADLPAEELK